MRELVANLRAHASRVQRDITYCTAGDVALLMDLYYPTRASGRTPLVIFVHGGGWSEGSKLGGGDFLLDAPALLDAGFTLASLDYRLAPAYKFPAMIEDVKCAVRSLRAHAETYRIDPERIGIWGTSAGSHLAILVGVTDSSAGFDVGEYLDQSSRVRAVLDMYGPADLTVDMSRAFVALKELVFSQFDLEQASPVHYVSPDDPPILILQGDLDPVVPLSQSQTLYHALTAAGVQAQLVVVQGAGHGFRTSNTTPTRAELTTMIVKFFEEHLK